MNFFLFLRVSVWPAVKVKLTYWWWIIKYRGKKNIPREVVSGALIKSMNRMQENLKQAFRVAPPHMGENEKKQLLEAISKAQELQDEISDLKR